MRRLLFILMAVVSSLIVVSCKDKGPDTAAIAAHAAKGYYDQLLHGDYKAFVEGTYHPERIPDNYREQLETAAKMFMAQQQVDHRGIKSVKVQGCDADTAAHVANAYLIFSYGDSTEERVCVPMVESRGTWYLR
ncbi:MAG: hypothetical protein ACOCOT_01980 [Prevotella sp.]|jgi:hypothetical protein|nr:hypothetical protein [Prevotella sp.]